jgi:enamine deaminase RidA (YjgF/YER057c/UK114 family)
MVVCQNPRMIEQRLAELGIELPPPPSAIAAYVPVRVVGRLAYVSGQVPLVDGVPLHAGKVGDTVTPEQAAEAARRCALQVLSALRAALGTLDLVVGIVQLTVFVASATGFNDQPTVANSASDLFVEVFGEAGKHSRIAVGVSELPLGVPVELAVIAEL